MMIKFGNIKPGHEFMFRSGGASTVYLALSVTKLSECITEVNAVGKLSNRKRYLKKQILL